MEFAEDLVLPVLREHAAVADAEPAWPAASWEALRTGGVLGWYIPQEYGGQGEEGVTLLDGYERLASACLTTCFLLSQREAACRRIRDSANTDLRRGLLPPLARGETFATVGLSQLTTSRQHTRPTIMAHTAGNALVLEGTIPWVTGAARADHFVIGANLEEGGQILAALPRATPGVHVSPPLELMALQGSLTAEIRCDGVALDRHWLLAGPAERVLTGGGGTGGLETSALALGLTRAAVAYLREEAKARPDLLPRTDRLAATHAAVRQEMHRLAEEDGAPERAPALRARANALVLQATQTALTAAKGTGFLRQHPAQRWARQALFFLVWSCPRPAADATLDFLTPSLE
jgi:butyryl-CoA dehydrogenase